MRSTVKSPAVIHFKCLDTFALQGVARSFGSGAAGVRLTRDGLARHVRPSERAREEREEEEAREDEAAKAELDALLAREEKCDTLIPHVTEGAQVMLPPPPASPRASMASLATIEMGLRKPTTWAVALLTLGVSFGVGLARVASNAAAIDPVAVSAAAPPRAAESLPPPVLHAAPVVGSASTVPVTVAITTIVGRRHHHSHALAAAAEATLGTTADDTASPLSDRSAPADARPADTKKSAAADKKTDAADDKSDDGDETTAAAAAAARAHSELSNSL